MINSCTFIGNLGRDPEIRSAQSGTSVANFSLAVDCGYGEKKTTEWVRCVAFGKTADAVGKYLHKGSRCYVNGEMRTRSWEKDGEKKYLTEIIVNTVKFLDRKENSGGGETEPEPTVQAARVTTADLDDEIPF